MSVISIQDSFHKPSKFVSLSVKSFFNVKKSNSFRTCLYSHSNVMLSKCLQNEAGTFSLKSVFTTHDNSYITAGRIEQELSTLELMALAGIAQCGITSVCYCS